MFRWIVRTVVSILALLVLCFYGITNIAYAGKNGIIRGVVIDFVTKEPLFGANIYIRDFKTGTVSDKDGKFQLQLNTPVETTIEITYVGYEKKEIKINLSDGEEKELTVYLNPGALMMDEILVTGSKVRETVFNSTNFVSVVTEEEIKTTNYATTADVLWDEPGILVQKTTHGHGTPIIRGMIGRQVLLLYNGIRLNRPTFRVGGNQYMDTINPESLSSIEVTRGPTSLLYGSDAIGGSINMVTHRYESEGPGFKFYPGLKLDYSSSDDGKNAAFVFRGSKSYLSYSGNLTYKNVGNLDPGGDEKKQVPTGWEELDGNLNLYFESTQVHTFEFNYINVNQDKVPRYDKYAANSHQKYIYDPQERRLYGLTYTFSPALLWLHQMKWNISYQEENEGRITQKVGSSKISTQRDKFKTVGTYLNFSSVIGGRHWLTWGGEYYRDKLKSGAVSEKSGVVTVEPRGAYPDNSRYNASGIFLQDIFLVNPALELRGGLRYSYVSYESPLGDPFGTVEDNFSDVTGSAGLKYKLTPSVNAVASYARGFRAPNFNDAVVLKVSGTGVDAPSPNLNQETSHNFEIGLKVGSEYLTGAIFGFYSRMNDLIIRRNGIYLGLPFFDDNGNGIWDANEAPIKQKFNAGKAEISGIEIYGAYKLGAFTYRGQLTYIYGEQENIDEDTETAFKEPMSKIPPLMGMAAIRWNKSENWWVEANMHFAGKQDRLSLDDKDDSRIPVGGTPGYKTFSLKGMFIIPGGRVVVTFENIFDELYKTHASGIYFPGRSITVSYQINPFMPGK